MYISFRGVRVSPANAKWAFRVSIAGLTLLAIGLIADRVTRTSQVAFYTYFGAQLSMLAAIVIAVPGIVIPLGLLLAPLGIATFGLNHNQQVWTSWWFWILAVACEVAGGFALVWFGRKYGKRHEP